MGKLKRDVSTPEKQAWWDSIRRAAEEVRQWPKWKQTAGRYVILGRPPHVAECKCGECLGTAD